AGGIDFVLDGVGSGSGQADGLDLHGDFEFDLKAFKKASVAIDYTKPEGAGENDPRAWSFAANLEFEKGKLPGIGERSVKFSYSEKDSLKLAGEALIDAPGVSKEAKLSLKYEDKTGALSLGGHVPLEVSRIPGVKSAVMDVEVTRDKDGNWSVGGAGKAELG